MAAESKRMKDYFDKIHERLSEAYNLAEKARSKNLDPEDRVDILLAKNMAERVEGLMSVAAPQIKGSRLSTRLEELEQKYGILSWEVALKIAEEVAEEKFCKFTSKKEAMEMGIRVGFAYHTLGIVSAPLEGFLELEIKKTRSGEDYFAVRFAGPIRGAGGTGASVCVLIADYIRKHFGYGRYDPNEQETNRFVSELSDYHERITNLQYNPSEEELKFLISHLPVEVDGDPSEGIEVSNYKDLPRVATNRIRSGVCLVVSMICLKAPKLWKRLKVWGTDFGLEWNFLEEFLKIQKLKKAGDEGSGDNKGKTKKLAPNLTYISDLVAGRPVLSNPLAQGGFRLRYGRSRLSGFSAAAIHPSTSFLLEHYIATGTQIKVERPGKAAAITFCDTIEGPIVKLRDGSVVLLQSEALSKLAAPDVVEIIYLGDILFSYGDFSENGHFLCPAGYCEEWYTEELRRAIEEKYGSFDLEKASSEAGLPLDDFMFFFKHSQTAKISCQASLALSKCFNVPLHPKYTYHWRAITENDVLALKDWIQQVGIKSPLQLPYPEEESLKKSLEHIGIPHLVKDENLMFDKDAGHALLISLGLAGKNSNQTKTEKTVDRKNLVGYKGSEDVPESVRLVNELSGMTIRDKSGTFIGARMGRPEKAKQRKLTGSPHVLFPVGEQGGRLRSFQAAREVGKVFADFPLRWCLSCDRETVYKMCEVCNKETEQRYYCRGTGIVKTDTCPDRQPAQTYNARDINITHFFKSAVSRCNMNVYPDLIKGVRGTSNKDHIPEQLAKGILRAKHDVFVNKDGTTRYDMSEIPVTHFKPREIGTSVEKLIELGYDVDAKGAKLIGEDQVIELKPQDVILPGSSGTDQSADAVLLHVARFVNNLLVCFYGLEPWYKTESKDDLVGELVIGLAPHISAGLIGRIIGFSKTQGCFAHPLWHAGLRRDCDGDEACVMLLMDGLLNFSRQYLPDKRGAKTMDSPLVLTSKLVPSEVDDMVLGLDVVWSYPLEFYEAAAQLRNPWDVPLDQLGKRVGKESQYEGMGYTHEVSDMNSGVTCSAYKTLPSMEEKLKGQMVLAERINAVDPTLVASLVIEKHFLKDTKGNLRKFSQQQFRCVTCNTKFRRPPLLGVCTVCGKKIIFTISEGSIVKYLEPSISLAEKYNVSDYLKQTLQLTKRRVEAVFGREKERQEGLGRWFDAG